MKTETILVVDDDASFRRIVEYTLREAGYQVEAYGSSTKALEMFAARSFGLVISDMRMPDLSGLQLLTEIQDLERDVPIVIVTAHADVDNAVEAMREGAFDYLQKPINRDELKLVVERAFEWKTLRRENRQLKQAVTERLHFENMVGASSSTQKVFATAVQAARFDSTVLILGESGTGKELLAKAIHFNSPRRDQPFVVVNCGAIPENLLESELFGHLRGSFTGAVSDRRGKIEAAAGGTVFLDEIGELDPSIQVKLLRLLQEKEIDKVGAAGPIEVDVRIIAATHRPLEKLTRAGEFREDLYYRLSVIPILLPPLRERREDIPLLANLFLKKYAERFGKEVSLERAVLKVLDAYHWPGNIRELENLMERLVALTEAPLITVDDLPTGLTQPCSDIDGFVLNLPPEGVALERVEEYLLREALRRNGGNQTRAARFLQITRNTLIYRMQKYGLAQREEIDDEADERRTSTTDPTPAIRSKDS